MKRVIIASSKDEDLHERFLEGTLTFKDVEDFTRNISNSLKVAGDNALYLSGIVGLDDDDHRSINILTNKLNEAESISTKLFVKYNDDKGWT